jgi:hypothetical protein
MLQGERQNIQHSKLPQPGEVGRILGLPMVEPRRRCIVSHYPLATTFCLTAEEFTPSGCDFWITVNSGGSAASGFNPTRKTAPKGAVFF